MRMITRAPGACAAILWSSSSASAANCSTPGGVGVGDVGGALDGVAEGDAVAGHAEAEAEVDLAARGAVEPPAELGQRRHDLGRRVGLHGVVDRGVAEARRERAVLGAQHLEVEDHRRPVELARADVGVLARGNRARRPDGCRRVRAGSPAKAAACRMRISISPGLVPEFPKETLPSLREFSRKGTLQRRVRWRQRPHMRPRPVAIKQKPRRGAIFYDLVTETPGFN